MSDSLHTAEAPQSCSRRRPSFRQPPERKFSIVSASDARQAIGAESGDVALASTGFLKTLLDKKALLIASSSPVIWNPGSYAVAVQCPTEYKVRLVTLERGTPKTLDIKC